MSLNSVNSVDLIHRARAEFKYEAAEYKEKLNQFIQEINFIKKDLENWAGERVKDKTSLKKEVDRLIDIDHWAKQKFSGLKKSSCIQFIKQIKEPHEDLFTAELELNLFINLAEISEKYAPKDKIEKWNKHFLSLRNSFQTDLSQPNCDVRVGALLERTWMICTKCDTFNDWRNTHFDKKIRKLWDGILHNRNYLQFTAKNAQGWQKDLLNELIQQADEKGQDKTIFKLTNDPKLYWLNRGFFDTFNKINVIGIVSLDVALKNFEELYKENETFAKNCKKHIPKFNEKEALEIINNKDLIKFVKKIYIAMRQKMLDPSSVYPWTDEQITDDKYKLDNYDWQSVKVPRSFCKKEYFQKEAIFFLPFAWGEDAVVHFTNLMLANAEKQPILYLKNAFFFSLLKIFDQPDYKIWKSLDAELEILREIDDPRYLYGLRHLAYQKKNQFDTPFWSRIVKLLVEGNKSDNPDVKAHCEELYTFCGHTTEKLFKGDQNRLELLFDGLKAKKRLDQKLNSLMSEIELLIKDKKFNEKKFLYHLCLIQLAAENGLNAPTEQKGLSRLHLLLDGIMKKSESKKILKNAEIAKFNQEILAYLDNSSLSREPSTIAQEYDPFRLSILGGNIKDAELALFGSSNLYEGQLGNILEHFIKDIESHADNVCYRENLLAYILAYLETPNVPTDTQQVIKLKGLIEKASKACCKNLESFSVEVRKKIERLQNLLEERVNSRLKDQNSLKSQYEKEEAKKKVFSKVRFLFTTITAENPITKEEALAHLSLIKEAAKNGFGVIVKDLNLKTEGEDLSQISKRENKLKALLERITLNAVYKEPTVKSALDEVYLYIKDRRLSRKHSIENMTYETFLGLILKGSLNHALDLVQGCQYYSATKNFLQDLLDIVKKYPENELYFKNLLFIASLYLEKGDRPLDARVFESVKNTIQTISEAYPDKKDKEILELKATLESNKKRYLNQDPKRIESDNNSQVHSRAHSISKHESGRAVSKTVKPQSQNIFSPLNQHDFEFAILHKTLLEMYGKEVRILDFLERKKTTVTREIENIKKAISEKYKGETDEEFENRKKIAQAKNTRLEEELSSVQEALKQAIVSVELRKNEIQNILESSPHYMIEKKIWGIYESLAPLVEAFEEKLIEKSVDPCLREAFDYASSFFKISTYKVSRPLKDIESRIPENLREQLQELKKVEISKYPLSQLIAMFSNPEDVEDLFTSYLAEAIGKTDLSEYAGTGDTREDPATSPNFLEANERYKTLFSFVGYLFLLGAKKRFLKTSLIQVMDLAHQKGHIILSHLIHDALACFAKDIFVKSDPTTLLKKYEGVFDNRLAKVREDYQRFEESNTPYIPIMSKLFNTIVLASDQNPFDKDNVTYFAYGLEKVAEIREQIGNAIRACQQHSLHKGLAKFSNFLSIFSFNVPKESLSGNLKALLQLRNENRAALKHPKKA